jgi:hypothetical protein
MSQFGVDPDTLTDLAGKFDREAKDLAKPIDGFAASASASEIGEAFGLLGACDDAAQKYQTLLNGTLKALGQLPGVLTSGGDRLRLNATNSTRRSARRAPASSRMSGTWPRTPRKRASDLCTVSSGT